MRKEKKEDERTRSALTMAFDQVHFLRRFAPFLVLSLQNLLISAEDALELEKRRKKREKKEAKKQAKKKKKAKKKAELEAEARRNLGLSKEPSPSIPSAPKVIDSKVLPLVL